MQLNLTIEDVANVISAMEQAHKKFSDEATSWSFDLEGDFEKYVELRNKELALAHTINRIKRQRTAQAAGDDSPLEDWEKDLLAGKTPS